MPIAEDLDTRFTYHAPTPDQIPVYNELRDKTHELAKAMVESCPESRELSLAITHLEQAVMWANAAVARRSPVKHEGTG